MTPCKINVWYRSGTTTLSRQISIIRERHEAPDASTFTCPKLGWTTCMHATASVCDNEHIPHNHTVTQPHSHTATQSHSHTVTQPHSHTTTQSHSHAATQRHNHTVTQPHSHTTTQPHNHTTTQSHNHTVTQPHSHTATQPHNHTTTQSHSHTVTQPHSHAATQRHNHTVTQPHSHTTTQPHNHTITQPHSHTTTQPHNQAYTTVQMRKEGVWRGSQSPISRLFSESTSRQSHLPLISHFLPHHLINAYVAGVNTGNGNMSINRFGRYFKRVGHTNIKQLGLSIRQWLPCSTNIVKLTVPCQNCVKRIASKLSDGHSTSSSTWCLCQGK